MAALDRGGKELQAEEGSCPSDTLPASVLEEDAAADCDDWDGPDDPENPRNWPLSTRILHSAVPAVYAFGL